LEYNNRIPLQVNVVSVHGGKNMNFLSAAEVAVNWGISKRRVTILCKEGRIPGAEIVGNMWLIPKDAKKPVDPRKERKANK